MGGSDEGPWPATQSSTPVKIQGITLSEIPTAAIGRIERKRASARSELRRSLETYWLDIKASQYKQRGFEPDEVVRFFQQYALSVFDAYAVEYLGSVNQPPQHFIKLLHDDLIPRVWSELDGDLGVWRAVMEESLDLSGFAFPHLPGRSIHKSDFLAARRRDRIEATLKQRIDEQWVSRAWDQLEHQGRAEEGNGPTRTINTSTGSGVVIPHLPTGSSHATASQLPSGEPAPIDTAAGEGLPPFSDAVLTGAPEEKEPNRAVVATNLAWSDVQIHMDHEHYAQIKIACKSHNATYSEMGFADRRGRGKDNPNEEWWLLQELAWARGELNLARYGKQRGRALARMRILNKTLQKYFAKFFPADTPPIRYEKGRGHVAKFGKIDANRSEGPFAKARHV
jgi:hypothetical protein